MCGIKTVTKASESQCTQLCHTHTGFRCTGFGYRQSDGCHLYKDNRKCGNVGSLNWYTC